jgi:hypothetical protein
MNHHRLFRDSFEIAMRRFCEPTWEKLSYIVDIIEPPPAEIPAARVKLSSSPTVEWGDAPSDKAIEGILEYMAEVACDVAKLPERLVGSALLSWGFHSAVQPSELLANDGRPAVDDGDRYGVTDGMVVKIRKGTDPEDAKVVRDCFSEARRRIMDSAIYADFNPMDLNEFFIIHGEEMDNTMVRAMDGQLETRICGSRVHRWNHPDIQGHSWYLFAVVPMGLKPFAWHVKHKPSVESGKLVISGACGMHVRDTWSIAKIECCDEEAVGA